MKAIVLFTILCSQPIHHATMKMNHNEKVKANIINTIEKRIQHEDDIQNAYLLVHCDSKNIHWNMNFSKTEGEYDDPNQPYHIASIGKTFTATIIAMFVEKKMLDLSDPIAKYLDIELINELHVYKGKDYSQEITIHHLLNHTSGLADYFMDKSPKGKRGMDLMLDEPDHFWTPRETVAWTKNNLSPHFPPGKKFHYSDTNYQLLGLIIEKITGLSLHEVYATYIFHPVGMESTWLHMFSEAPETAKEMAPVYHKGSDISHFKSTSMSWASGGIVSTNEDMLKFMKAFHSYALVSKPMYDKMHQWVRAMPGMSYGYGLMQFDFILTPKSYQISGHSGSIGSFMYYNKSSDTYIIGSFNKVNYTRQPVMLVFKILRYLKKLKH